MARKAIQPATVHPTVGYSHARRAGNTLYVSGQVPRTVDNEAVDPGDLEAQVRQVFDNLEAVLVAAGGSPDDIVKLTTYLTHRDQFATWRKVRDSRFREPYPASTLVIVDSLSYPEYLVEVDAIAVLDR